MITFKGETFAECYRTSLDYLLENGSSNGARGTSSKELLNVALVIEDPSQCLYENDTRGSKFNYIAAELMWYYLGRNDVAFISNWAKFWETIQNEDGTVNSAYGNLIFNRKNSHNFTQYQWAIESLLNDRNTRQAVMHFNLPDHQYNGNKDFVCTMYVNCHIRNNKLHLSTFMRSNDAIWGTPTDVAFFCSLQMQMLSHLREAYPELELGTYTHVSNSYHVYDRHFSLLDKMLETDFHPVVIPPVLNDLIDIDGTPSTNLKIIFNDILNDKSDNVLIFQENDLLLWIYRNITSKK